MLELPLAGDGRGAGAAEPRGRGRSPSSLLAAPRRGRRPRRSPTATAPSVARGYGALRPVVVLGAGLPAGRARSGRRGRRGASRCAGCRSASSRAGRWPSPGEALGLVPPRPLPAGSYLLAAQLRPPRPARAATAASPAAGGPVEIAVSGADALLAAGAAPVGREGRRRRHHANRAAPAPGRTYVAAAGVPLLALGPGADGPGPAAPRRRRWA